MGLTRRGFICALPLLALFGCRGKVRQGPVLIGVRTSNCQTPFFVAQQQDRYEQVGVQSEVRLVGSNTEIVEAMQRGDLQMGSLPVTTAIAAMSRGAPMRIVAMTGRGSDGLLVRAEDGARELEGLCGARIATIRASILDVLLRETLASHGLDPDEDVELVYMSSLGDMISALKTGQVAATSNTEPFMTDAERQGWGRILGYYTAVWPDHPCCVVVSSTDLLERDPESVEAILGVHCAAVDWCHGHDAEAAQIVVDTLGAFDADLVRESMHEDKMTLSYDVDPAEVERMARLMAEQGLIEAVPATPMVDTAPLQRALKRKAQ